MRHTNCTHLETLRRITIQIYERRFHVQAVTKKQITVMSPSTFNPLTSVNTQTCTRLHTSTRANSAWASNKHRPDYNDKDRHTSGGGEKRGTPMSKSSQWVQTHEGPKTLPSDVSPHVRVCVCVHIPAKSPQPPLAQFRESSYLFCSVLQRITRKHNVRRVSHQPSVNFWGTETEGRVIKKGLAVDLVVDFIWKSNAATAFGRVDPSLRARGQIGRTYLRQKGHVSFFPNLPRQHLHASYLSRVFLKSPTSEESDFENFGVKTSPVSHNVPRQLA